MADVAAPTLREHIQRTTAAAGAPHRALRRDRAAWIVSGALLALAALIAATGGV